MQSLLELFGGLAIFVYGVHLLSEGLERVAGSQFLSLLEKSTDHPLKGLVFGVVATALMQSSGLLMVTMIGLINANLLTLQQAIGIMLGQEIGTTITGQLVSFQIKGFNLFFLIIGFSLKFFSRKRKIQLIGQPLFGFGVVFVGMNMMSKAGAVISQTTFFQNTLLLLSKQVVLGVLVGAVFTAAIQSSTAMTGLVIAMGKSNSITLAVAIAIILGANIGSCIMGWLAAIQSSSGAKRASYAQILMNIAGVLLFLPIITPYTDFISATSNQLARQIANAHSIFNIIVSILMFPFVKTLTKFVEKIIPEKEQEKDKKKKTLYIDSRLLKMPFIAVQLAKDEVLRMGWIAHDMLVNAKKGLIRGKMESAKWVLKREKDLDKISRNLESFLEEIPGDKLNLDQNKMSEDLKHLITDIERVGDHANNLAEFAVIIGKKKIKISKYGRKELRNLFKLVIDTYGLSLQVFKSENTKKIDIVARREEKIDALEREYKKNHIERLKQKICHPEADTIYIETLRNLERVGDHAYNIALSIKY